MSFLKQRNLSLLKKNIVYSLYIELTFKSFFKMILKIYERYFMFGILLFFHNKHILFLTTFKLKFLKSKIVDFQVFVTYFSN